MLALESRECQVGGANVQLSDRKKQILQVAIEDYISSCSPITSGGLKDLTKLDCSTATLRSELNALEAMGYLKQLHTSGGRVPTAQGYRFYVESMLANFSATNRELEKVRCLIEQKTNSLSDLISQIAKVIGEATNYPTVVMASGVENLILQDFQIIPLLSQEVLVLIGTNSGYINERLNISATKRECDDASRFFKKHFVGKTIKEMTDQFELQDLTDEIKEFQQIVDCLVLGLKRFNNRKLLDVQKTGAVKLLESGEIEKAKHILSVLEDEDELIEVMNSGDENDDIIISIAENDEEVSVVKVPIKVGTMELSVGVIGPQRMDYNGVSAALKLLADELENLKGGDGP